MKPYVLGIDPGASGALCFWWPEVDAVEMFDMPVFKVPKGGKLRSEIDRYTLGRLIRDRAHLIRVAVIEQVASMPRDGHAGAFTFGKAAGMAEMACAAHNVPIFDVTPAAWKRAMRVTADKDTSRRAASNLAPRHAALWTLKKHDGRAEAFLLAHYGARHS
jgi:Holliday junction resolvasome RuvABC endonuclease subunit